VRRKLDHLLKRGAATTDFIQFSINAIKRMGNVLICVNLRFFRLTVVAVKNKFVEILGSF
jgi:hypothetical protein